MNFFLIFILILVLGLVGFLYRRQAEANGQTLAEQEIRNMPYEKLRERLGKGDKVIVKYGFMVETRASFFVKNASEVAFSNYRPIKDKEVYVVITFEKFNLWPFTRGRMSPKSWGSTTNFVKTERGNFFQPFGKLK